jgi:hypothetical protein
VRLIGIYVMSVISASSAAASVWLVITGRNLPGLLGRGFTKGDNQRLKRAPRDYFRALGLFVGVAGLDGFFFAWVISLLPRPSVAMLELAAAVTVVLTLPTTAAAVWLFVLAARYRLFRWDKP